jgi:D-alanine transaminase/branched-chain amino acid aminotransferase
MIAYFNDAFTDQENLTLKITDLSIQRGYAAFDFLRAKDFKPVFIDDYLGRFCQSVEMLGLENRYTIEELKGIIHELIDRNKIAETGIKLLYTGGDSADGYRPAMPNLVITLLPVQLTTPEKFNTGSRIITWQYQRDLPAIKSINYLVGVWLQKKIQEQNADDALYHEDGYITEFPRSNVFIVTDKKVITPSENVLNGITRKKILELAATQYEVQTRPVSLDDLSSASEIFMSSTTKRILPVVQVDGAKVGDGRPGPVSISLNEKFKVMEEEYLKSFRW